MKDIDIEKFLDLKGYDTDIRKERRKKNEKTNEFFTPHCIVKRMCDKISEDDWKDKTKTFLEPAAGNGQFVCYIIYKRLMSNVSVTDVFKTLYATELMQDNVNEMYKRIFKLLDEMEVEYNYDEIHNILEHNIVCADFFKWDYSNWRPLNKKLF